jgi:hypothetical protein
VLVSVKSLSRPQGHSESHVPGTIVYVPDTIHTCTWHYPHIYLQLPISVAGTIPYVPGYIHYSGNIHLFIWHDPYIYLALSTYLSCCIHIFIWHYRHTDLEELKNNTTPIRTADIEPGTSGV